MSCLDDRTVLQFVSGHLDGADRDRVETELGRCQSCAALVAALLRDDEDVGGDPSLPIVDPDVYVAGREVARGGMGRILAAHDRRLGRDVALKQLLASDPALAARFLREVRITARLQHPAIVPVYEAGRWPSGEAFYAMKLVAGRPLDR